MIHTQPIEREPSDMDTGNPRVGVFICHCGLNIARTVDCARVAEAASGFDDVLVARNIPYACSKPGQASIREDIAAHRLDRVVVASCSPRLHEPTFRQRVQAAGINPYLFEIPNIREHYSWVHMHESEAAIEKAVDLTRRAVARVRRLRSLQPEAIPLTRRTLVIGGGVAGIQASLDLADAGYEVVLVEKEPSIGGRLTLTRESRPWAWRRSGAAPDSNRNGCNPSRNGSAGAGNPAAGSHWRRTAIERWAPWRP